MVEEGDLGRIETSVITDETDFKSLQQEWNELWQRVSSAAFSQSYSFCLHSWEEIVKAKGRSLFCVTIRENKRLVLVWPMAISSKGPFKIVRSLGPDSGEASDMLVDPESDVDSNAQLAWNAVVNTSGADILKLLYVKSNSVLCRRIPKTYEATGCDSSPYADFSDQDSWAEFCELIGANSRRKLNRKLKRLSEMGEFRFVKIDTAEDPDKATKLIDWMMGQKQQWASHKKKNGPWLSSEEYHRYLIKLTTDPANVQRYVLFAILIKDVPIAVKLAAFNTHHVDLIFAAYNSETIYSKYSPGLVLDTFWMKEVLEDHLNIDFGAGGEAYKLFWSRDFKHDMFNYEISLTLIGKIALAGYHVLSRFRDVISSSFTKTTKTVPHTNHAL
ncbi:MAG: family N-acetyltransferase [Sphingobacteriaceae bacterium]|jgi:CelD/BcsL family acetyltransferase involved in cellulose biosynthesis|nr:family N-acetyltransferase [Sphingobacteriaceae bacterium]